MKIGADVESPPNIDQIKCHIERDLYGRAFIAKQVRPAREGDILKTHVASEPASLEVNEGCEDRVANYEMAVVIVAARLKCHGLIDVAMVHSEATIEDSTTEIEPHGIELGGRIEHTAMKNLRTCIVGSQSDHSGRPTVLPRSPRLAAGSMRQNDAEPD